MTAVASDSSLEPENGASRPPRSRARMTEADLVRTFGRSIRGAWPVRAMGLEVKSHGRCRTDVCIRVRDIHELQGPEYVIGIEAKLTEASRAIRQAALNQYAVDASYVAMPQKRINYELMELARAYGVGVLGVAGRDFNLILPARLGSPDPSLRERMNSQLQHVRARGTARVNDLVRTASA